MARLKWLLVSAWHVSRGTIPWPRWLRWPQWPWALERWLPYSTALSRTTVWRRANWFYMKYSTCTCNYAHLWAWNIFKYRQYKRLVCAWVHVHVYSKYRWISVRTKVYFSRQNLCKLQYKLLFAKVEARGVWSNTNKHGRREKQN